MTKAPAHEVLRRLFDVIASEAKRNDALARQVVEALGGAAADKLDKPAAAPRKTYESADFHAINVLRSHGESALRGRLEQIRASDRLRSIANASGLVLSGSASKAKASRAELIDGIISAAKHYDAQRSEAAVIDAAVQASPPPGH
jgi:hypothetical protein